MFKTSNTYVINSIVHFCVCAGLQRWDGGSVGGIYIIKHARKVEYLSTQFARDFH